MSTPLLQTRRDGNSLTVTLDRPAKANALNRELLAQLAEVFAAARSDASLHALILTGAGERAFCAGADLNELGLDAGERDLWAEMAAQLRGVSALSVAAINGACMGGGLTLALGCDVRVCVASARFAYPVLKNHVLPGQYDVDALRALMGPGRTNALLLGGVTISAAQAAQWGLVDQLLAPDADALSAAQSLVGTACAADGQHLRALKAMIQEPNA